MNTNVGSSLQCITMKCLVESFPAFDASFNDGLDKASAPTENGVFTLIEVGALGIAHLLSGAPMCTEAAFKEMVPTNGILLIDGGMYCGVKR